MPLASLSPDDLVRRIAAAERRIVFMAPGVHKEVAHALAKAWQRLGKDAVSIILDTRPEVFRLGFGSFDALDLLHKAALGLNTMVCHQEGVQVGVLVIDDLVAVYAPKALMVAEADLEEGEINGVILDLKGPDEDIADQVGASGNPMKREFGLDRVSTSSLDVLKEDLEKNPPQRFDLVRKVQVFNAQFDFVELVLKGSQVARKEVTLPPELSAISSDDVRSKLRTSYRLIDANAKIAKAQDEVTRLRKEIERRFLRVVPGHGMAVLRRDRDDFEAELLRLRNAAETFQKIVEDELETSISTSVDEITKAISPGIQENPTAAYQVWQDFHPGGTADDYVRNLLQDCFDEGAKEVQCMSVNVIFKSVTYESLKDPKFLVAAKKAFPHLGEIFEEYEAARGSAVEGENGTK